MHFPPSPCLLLNRLKDLGTRSSSSYFFLLQAGPVTVLSARESLLACPHKSLASSRLLVTRLSPLQGVPSLTSLLISRLGLSSFLDSFRRISVPLVFAFAFFEEG